MLKTVLDIWNGYIKWVIFGEEDGKTIVLAKELLKTKGMRKWKILDAEQFAHSINEVIESLSKKIGGDFIEDIVVSVSHPHTIMRRTLESKRLMNTQVSRDDVNQLSQAMMDETAEPNMEVIKIIPVQWIVDESMKVKDPLGMSAKKVELIADVFMIPKNFSTNLHEALDRLDIHLLDLVPNILWASEVCLDFDAKDLWVLLIDIWANQTSYVVYEEWYPLLYGVIPMWGEDVTKDISIWLQVDIRDAERIKREKGQIILEKMTLEDDTIDLNFLSDIMLARYEELFEWIGRDLVSLQKDGRLPWWVLLMWWASKTKWLDMLAKDVFKLASFAAEDKMMRLWDLSKNPIFINVIGANVWSQKYQQRRWWFSLSSFSLNMSIFNKIREFLKKMF